MMTKTSGRSKDLFRLEDVKTVVGASEHRSRPVKVDASAMRSLAKGLNESARRYLDFLLTEPEARRIRNHMARIAAKADLLNKLIQSGIEPVKSPRHGSPQQIARRAKGRAESAYRALARTAGAGSLNRGIPMLRDLLERYRNVSDELIALVSATEREYTQIPDQIQAQFGGVRRQGDHRPADSRALALFVFDILRTYHNIIGKPGTAAAGSRGGPAVRYLEAVFMVLRGKVEEEAKLPSSPALSPERNTLAYLIRSYNESNKKATVRLP
jgi:hypothetical protein